MKKLILFIILALIMVSNIFFISSKYRHTSIPKLTVIYKGKNLNVAQGSYYWKAGFKTKKFTVNNYADIINNLNGKKDVINNGQLELHFDYQPEIITLSGGYTQNAEPTIKNNIINISQGEGTQIYFIDCKWREGTVTYVVVVQIKDL